MIPQVAVEWLQPYAQLFFAAKGALCLAATLLLIVHMLQTFDYRMPLGQRLRYLTLLYLSALIASASYEQVHDNADVDLRNVGGLVGAVLLAFASVISIVQDTRRR